MGRVAVTGGCGFMGSQFLRHLVARTDYQVLCIDALLEASDRGRISALERSGRVLHRTIDIRDRSRLLEALRSSQFDAVVHFAAQTSVDRSFHNRNYFHDVNVVGSSVLLGAAHEAGVRRLLHISTDEVFGPRSPSSPAGEDDEFAPTNPYAKSKADAEKLVEQFRPTTPTEIVVIRPSNVYGPAQWPEKLIPRAIASALSNKPLPIFGSGAATRCWLYVGDLNEALLRILATANANSVYNLPSPHVCSVSGVLDALESILGRRIRRKYGSDRVTHDASYAMVPTRHLLWSPETRLFDGLRATVAWYQENEDWTLARASLHP